MDLEKEIADLKASITPIKTIKFIFGTFVSCGAMGATVAILKPALANSKGLSKLMMKAGIFILGCKAGDVAEDYFGGLVDQITNGLVSMKEELKNESDAKE